jgi:16S rRNA (uracil1498-N3)-methyltransferase
MPVYFIQSKSIQNDRIDLTGELAHHLRDVLRCRPGEIVSLVDEKQVQYRAALDQVNKKQVVAKILRKDESPGRPARSVTLAQAILKGKKMDWVIQKSAELGVTTLIPVVTERTIARPKSERESHQTERWQAIAQEAAQQCGRLDIPSVQSTVTLDSLLKNPPESSLKLVLWEAEQKLSLKSALRNLKERTPISVLIGPEGGFPLREIEKAREAGWVTVSLGPRIVRAETAGMAVLAIIEYELNETR